MVDLHKLNMLDRGCALLFDWISAPSGTVTRETYEMQGLTPGRGYEESNMPAVNEEPWQPGDFSAVPRYMPGGIQFGVRLIGRPVMLDGPLRFLPVIHGLMDRPVQ
jgi:hypothetical protein